MKQTNEGNNWIYCNAGNNKDMPTEPTRYDIEAALIALIKAEVPMSSQMVGEKRYGWAPIRDWYALFIAHSKAKLIRKCQGFIPKKIYPDKTNILFNEIGSIANFRIFVRENNDEDLFLINKSNLNRKIFSMICMPIGPDELTITYCGQLREAKYWDDRVELLYTDYK